MRYREIIECCLQNGQDDPRKTLSLYVLDSETTDCMAMILCHGGKLLGTTKVPATGGMTIQVRCATANAAYDLFAAWLDRTKTNTRRPR